MRDHALEAVSLLFDLLVVVGAAAFTGIGVRTELVAVESVMTGHVAAGAWLMFMGGVALFVGLYAFGYREALPRLRRRLAGDG